MDAKNLVFEQIERERSYLEKQEVGTDEYGASLNRLISLEEKLAELEHFESESVRKDEQMNDEKKDKKVKNIIEGCKVVAGVVLPLVGLVCITATEKDTTFTGALRDYTRLFIPKKWL